MSEDDNIIDLDPTPGPNGELMLQTVTMPRDTNASGDIFGGWLLAQMDVAGGVAAGKVAGGRVATVAIENMSFLVPVEVGAVISCYTQIEEIGRSSVRVSMEVWKQTMEGLQKVTDGVFIYVAIDERGRTCVVPRD